MKVLIVDDSIVFRTAIAQALSSVPGVLIEDKLSNGEVAVDYLKSHPDVDLVTMDVEMPEMDGIEATKKIREFNKNVTIVIFSGVSEASANKTVQALSSGANDFIPKIEGGETIESSIEMIRSELLPRVQSFLKKRPANAQGIELDQPIEKVQVGLGSVDLNKVLDEYPKKPGLICIGSSTGGPEALMKIFKGFDHKISIPMVIVQHMPPIFTKRMAESLSALSDLDVREAKRGDRLQPGVCYIAPGDYHLLLNSDKSLTLNQAEKVCFVRPSVDVFLESVAENFSGRTLNIILTGMGCDGANGAARLARKGDIVLAQDEDSSVVWGMPGAVHENGSAKYLLPLNSFSQVINKISSKV